MKRFFFTLLSFLIGISVMKADRTDGYYTADFEVDGIWYSLPTSSPYSTVTVTYVTYGGSKYKGKITIPETVTYNGKTYTVDMIGDSSFANAPITEISLPSTLKSICTQAFWNCDLLTSVIIPDNVEVIWTSAFSDCDNLTSVVCGKGLQLLESNAFSRCPKLTNVVLQEGLKTLWHSVFFKCTGLSEIEIPESIDKMGSFVFAECSSLKKVKIKSRISTLPKNTFQNCTALTDVELTSSILEIDKYAFQGCTALESIDLPKRLVNIQYGAFDTCSALKSIEFPSSLTSIGGFSNCTSLTEINFPPRLGAITMDAFLNCQNLSSLNLPNTIYMIAGEAFGNCTNLTSVHIDDVMEPGSMSGDVQISQNSFLNCPIQEVYLGKSLRMNAPVGKTEELKKLTIGDNVSSLGFNCFQNCVNLSELTLPDNLIELGEGAFNGCNGLRELSIPGTVITMGPGAFNNCTSLTKLTYQSGQWGMNIGENVNFVECPITEIVLNRNIEGKLRGNLTTIKELTIGEDTSFIGEEAFKGCTELTEVVIPNNSFSLYRSAFEGCTGIRSVTFSSTMNYIGTKVFADNASLNEIYIPMSNPPAIFDDTFDGVNKAMCNLYVPVGSKDLYAEAPAWKEFLNIEEYFESSGIQNPLLIDDIIIIRNGAIQSSVDITSVKITSLSGIVYFEGKLQKGETLHLESGLYILTSNDTSLKIRV